MARSVASSAVSTYMRAAILGATAGSRIAIPLAALSWSTGSSTNDASLRIRLNGWPWSLLWDRKTRIACLLGAIEEAIGDKLPFTPSRLAPVPLAGRLASGALAAAAVCAGESRAPVAGALLGAAASGASSVGWYRVRVRLSKRSHLPAPVWGALEDGVTLAQALWVTAPYRR